MRSPSTRVLSFAACGLTALALGTRSPETADQEPPLELVLEVDGRRIDVPLDAAFEVAIGERVLPMKIVAKPTRHFRFADVEFDYPRHLAFEVDRARAGLTTWTLDGSDCVIIVQEYAQDDLERLMQSLVEAMAGQLAQFGLERDSTTLDLGTSELSGTRLRYRVSGQRVQQDIFGVETASGCVVLIIQDSSRNDGTTTDETRAATELLRQTLEVSR